MGAISAHFAFAFSLLSGGVRGAGVVTFGGEGVPVFAATAGQNRAFRGARGGNSGACGAGMVTFGGEGGGRARDAATRPLEPFDGPRLGLALLALAD